METIRLLIAQAAIGASGIPRETFPEPLPARKRLHLYATPEGEPGPSADKLSVELMKSSVKSAVDWDRDSPTFGVRYISAETAVPSALREFTDKASQSHHSAWKSQNERKDISVIDAAKAASNGNDLADLDRDPFHKAGSVAEL
jgi:hypothetical protein